MRTIDIEYWVHPDGHDFVGIDDFMKNTDQMSFLTINKKRTDALGGGLYDLIIKLTEDISIIELAKSYIQDGVKILISVALLSLLKELKSLFSKNEKIFPSLHELTIKYLDCNVIIYQLYETGIEESIQMILQHICQLQLKHKKIFKKIQCIHIPMIKHIYSNNRCYFHVKLSVNEPIREFTKDYYFKYWGLTTLDGKFLFDLGKDKIIKKTFYTEDEYQGLIPAERHL